MKGMYLFYLKKRVFNLFSEVLSRYHVLLAIIDNLRFIL
jgi:hypothetical protein